MGREETGASQEDKAGQRGLMGEATQGVDTIEGYPMISSGFSKKKRHFFVPFQTMSLELMVVAQHR